MTAALRGINMVQLCHLYFLIHVVGRFHGRIYGGPNDGRRLRRGR